MAQFSNGKLRPEGSAASLNNRYDLPRRLSLDKCSTSSPEKLGTLFTDTALERSFFNLTAFCERIKFRAEVG
jgi:hypothetical protein